MMGDRPCQARPSPRKPSPTLHARGGAAPGIPFFAILIVAGLIVIEPKSGGRRLQHRRPAVPCHHLGDHRGATACNLLVRRRWPSTGWRARSPLLTIYALLVLILGSVAFVVARLVGDLPEYANAFDRIFNYLLDLSTRLGYGQEQLERLASRFS